MYASHFDEFGIRKAEEGVEFGFDEMQEKEQKMSMSLYDLDGTDFVIEFEITYIHTNEIINYND